MEKKAKNKKQTFIWGAAIIAFSHIVVKIIGAGFKIPLDRFILLPEGMGIYNAAYTIYNWLFMISTAGLPVAISKMVSEAYAVGNIKEANRIFSVARVFMLVLGLCGSLVMFFGAEMFAELIGVQYVKYSIMALSPSLFFVAMMSAYRGYTQGMGNMLPTAVSEVVEAAGKLGMGLVLALHFINYGVEYGAAGAIGGVTVGTACGFLILFVDSVRTRKRLVHNSETYKNEVTPKSGRQILKRLVVIAVPVTLGVSVFTLTSLIDTAMIMNQLAFLGYSLSERTSLFGYLNRAVTIFNVPPTIIAAISVSTVPAISAAISAKRHAQALDVAKSALRITILFAFPCAIGMSVLAEPILRLIYGDASHALLLRITALSVACVTLVQTGNAILQAYGKVWKPVRNMAIGGCVKILVNLALVSRPEININGAPIGTFLCYLTVMVLNLVSIKHTAGIKYELLDFAVKPILSVLVMGAATAVAYALALRMTGYYIIAMGIAVAVAVAVYGMMIFLVRCIRKEDVMLLPKGERLYAMLVRAHIMK